jgi:hypothetical protein
MSVTLTAQTVAFLFPPGYPLSEATILADSGVVQAAGASLGNDVQVVWRPYYNFAGGVQTSMESFQLTFFVPAATAANIVAGIAALKTRMQSLIPGLVNIVTWGEQVAFG